MKNFLEGFDIFRKLFHAVPLHLNNIWSIDLDCFHPFSSPHFSLILWSTLGTTASFDYEMDQELWSTTEAFAHQYKYSLWASVTSTILLCSCLRLRIWDIHCIYHGEKMGKSQWLPIWKINYHRSINWCAGQVLTGMSKWSNIYWHRQISMVEGCAEKSTWKPVYVVWFCLCC